MTFQKGIYPSCPSVHPGHQSITHTSEERKSITHTSEERKSNTYYQNHSMELYCAKIGLV